VLKKWTTSRPARRPAPSSNFPCSHEAGEGFWMHGNARRYDWTSGLVARPRPERRNRMVGETARSPTGLCDCQPRHSSSRAHRCGLLKPACSVHLTDGPARSPRRQSTLRAHRSACPITKLALRTAATSESVTQLRALSTCRGHGDGLTVSHRRRGFVLTNGNGVLARRRRRRRSCAARRR